jgi:Tat protein translocase TatB subunit
MFDIGLSELLLLAAIALIFIGPKQLPEIARVVARLLNELKRATGDIGQSNTLHETQQALTKTLLEGGKDLRAALKPPAPPPAPPAPTESPEVPGDSKKQS